MLFVLRVSCELSITSKAYRKGVTRACRRVAIFAIAKFYCCDAMIQLTRSVPGRCRTTLLRWRAETYFQPFFIGIASGPNKSVRVGKKRLTCPIHSHINRRRCLIGASTYLGGSAYMPSSFAPHWSGFRHLRCWTL
uniref:Uncharacterized protein n=1 Tax=uncultured alpha proteobacterium HF0130_06E21 TaxID=710808 RepID=E0XT25_9PROT|nr:hypothetical protein [uncultured alpha proteobacterium HF0130_06E21]